MMHRDVELLAIGAGPSNLALAVALEELAPDDLAERSLLIERADSIAWQRGMLLPWSKSQVSFLKDLVTLRNPRSYFSFVNYLHTIGRLDDFTNMASFTPYRAEISDYLRWVASSLTRVGVEFGLACTEVEPRYDAHGVLTGWLTRLSDESTITSRYLVVGAGRDPYVPPVFEGLSPERLIHSTQYLPRVAELSKELPYRVAVIGGAQSAAEMFHSLQNDLPSCRRRMVMRSVGLAAYESSKFVNELYYPSFVDEFYNASPEAREQILREMHRTNYSGIAPALLESLYSQVYLDRLSGQERTSVVTMTDVTAAREQDNEIVLELANRATGAVSEIHVDVVLLGTGFARGMPAAVRHLAAAVGIDRVEVTRGYRLVLGGPSTGACYLQGVNEATHGIADSLLSVLASRAGDIAADIFTHRLESQGEPAVAASTRSVA